MTEWLEKAARCRRLALVTTDQRAHDALLSLAAELDAKVAEAQANPPEFQASERKPTPRAD